MGVDTEAAVDNTTLQPGIELPSSTLQPPRSKQPRTETLVMDISHGLHVVHRHKVTNSIIILLV